VRREVREPPRCARRLAQLSARALALRGELARQEPEQKLKDDLAKKEERPAEGGRRERMPGGGDARLEVQDGAIEISQEVVRLADHAVPARDLELGGRAIPVEREGALEVPDGLDVRGAGQGLLAGQR